MIIYPGIVSKEFFFDFNIHFVQRAGKINTLPAVKLVHQCEKQYNRKKVSTK